MLRVEYDDGDAFRSEYDRNISNGGIFVPTRTEFELRERVEVELVLAETSASVLLKGEVVHYVSPELAANGEGEPGVAIQFLHEPGELRQALAPFASEIDAVDRERAEQLGRREAPRSSARVIAKIEIDGEWVDGRTRNVSTQGVLVALPSGPLAIGAEVRLRITHPTDGTQMKVRGVVARHAPDGSETCMGIRFRVSEEHRERIAAFMNRVRAADHNRRLGAITGPLAQLGPEGVLRMFATSTPEGTLTLSQGVDEGIVTIEQGRLRAVWRELCGKPALDVMLAWTDGSFEFEARAEPGLAQGPEMSLEEALGLAESPEAPAVAETPEAPAIAETPEAPAVAETLQPAPEPSPGAESDAACDADPNPEEKEALPEEILLEDEEDSEMALLELGEFNFDDVSGLEGADLESAVAEGGFSAEALGGDSASILADATMAVCDNVAQARAGLCKIEDALVDLARDGMTVGQAVEAIAEPDGDVYSALGRLLDEGYLELV